jgi:enoyl-CoA hydratase
MQYTQLTLDVNNHIAVLTLNNAPVNALSRTLNDEIIHAMDWISETDDVRVVIITGAGKIFCAGADLKGRADVIKGPGDMSAHSRRTRECFHSIRECSKPVIIAINGHALGAGLGITASGDIIVASETATLALPEIDVGLMGGASHAMRLFGHSRLRRMVFTGFRVPAAELYRQGIIEACVPAAELMDTALALATEIASKSPIASVMAKQTLNAIEDMSLRDGYRYEQDMTAAISKTEDAQEAKRAFLEKRAPVFVGR